MDNLYVELHSLLDIIAVAFCFTDYCDGTVKLNFTDSHKHLLSNECVFILFYFFL